MFIPAIPKSHTSLSLIDRLCWTIRDIAFNLNIEHISHQDIMNLILYYYNNSRHETLTKTLFKAYPELKYGDSTVFRPRYLMKALRNSAHGEETEFPSN